MSPEFDTKYATRCSRPWVVGYIHSVLNTRGGLECVMTRISPPLNPVVENTNTSLCDVRHHACTRHRHWQWWNLKPDAQDHSSYKRHRKPCTHTFDIACDRESKSWYWRHRLSRKLILAGFRIKLSSWRFCDCCFTNYAIAAKKPSIAKNNLILWIFSVFQRPFLASSKSTMSQNRQEVVLSKGSVPIKFNASQYHCCTSMEYMGSDSR